MFASTRERVVEKIGLVVALGTALYARNSDKLGGVIRLNRLILGYFV